MADYTFWLGLAMAIPLSVTANLFTPILQKKLEERSNSVTAKQRNRILTEYALVLKFQKNRNEFLEYLVLVVIRTTYVGAIVAVAISLFAYVPQLLAFLPVRWLVDLRLITLVPAALLSVVCAAAISSICGEALQVSRSLRRFSAYRSEVCSRLGGAIPEEPPQDPER